MTKKHAGTFKKMTVFNEARDATAPFRTIPAVGQEAFAVFLLQCLYDPILQSNKIRMDLRCLNLGFFHHAFSARQAMSFLYCAPSKVMGSSAPYARARACSTVSARAVTHSTRPPLVRSTPASSTRVPA